MRAMGTKASAFTGCIGLGGYLFGFACLARQGGKPAILICNQGVGGSSPSGGTQFFAKTRRPHAPQKSASVFRCASVPRIARPQQTTPPSYWGRWRKGDCG